MYLRERVDFLKKYCFLTAIYQTLTFKGKKNCNVCCTILIILIFYV